MYDLSFYEAVEKCFNGEGYIRGEKFKDGVYVKKCGDTLVAVDGLNSDRVVGNMYVNAGIMSQKYKLIKAAEAEELISGNGKLSTYFTKAL